jgi:hypothetical protein
VCRCGVRSPVESCVVFGVDYGGFSCKQREYTWVIQTSRGDFTRVQFERAVSAFGENYFVYDTKVTP